MERELGYRETKFTRQFKLETVRLIKERGGSYSNITELGRAYVAVARLGERQARIGYRVRTDSEAQGGSDELCPDRFIDQHVGRRDR
jgi:transposase-like protein